MDIRDRQEIFCLRPHLIMWYPASLIQHLSLYQNINSKNSFSDTKRRQLFHKLFRYSDIHEAPTSNHIEPSYSTFEPAPRQRHVGVFDAYSSALGLSLTALGGGHPYRLIQLFWTSSGPAEIHIRLICSRARAALARFSGTGASANQNLIHTISSRVYFEILIYTMYVYCLSIVLNEVISGISQSAPTP